MPVQPGDVIAGKYVVEKVLAAGGMGLVLAAHHKQLKRRVALKFLLPEFCSAPRVVERFLREAQAMTAIQNEHVARVIDVGTTTEGVPYMVMEHLEGEDLEQTLGRRGRLPPSEAVDYLLQGMEALAEAHVNGFVHRDLKPSNLFVIQRPDGSPLVKLLDFGISKALPTDDNPVELELTETRGMLGSPLYMAPEQIRDAKGVDTRADIWTLGIILHELIVGTSPFAGGNNVAVVLSAILAEGPVTLSSEIASKMPSGLADVIRRCLSREREDRYPTVADLATALEPFAPPDAKASAVRIRKTLAHHQRTSSSSTNSALALSGPVPPAAESHPPPVSGLAQTVAVSTSDVPTASSPSGSSALAETRGPKKAGADESTFGKYKLLALLGHGDMADVLLAVVGGPDGLGFSKLVVVKRLRADLVSDDESVAMLVDEARIAAKLNHPNVIQTHEVGEIDGEYYIAMEYLEGQSLHEILQRTTAEAPMPLAFRLGVMRDLLAGVHHAHELVDIDGTSFGLVHRDISPHNVFITYDGQVKVVDFGIAKVKGRTTQTQLGMIRGKVQYMSPEQAASEAIDRRSDVFGAGVVFWELLTEKRMWAGLDQATVLAMLTSDAIPSSPRAVTPDVPEALDTIVTKALARRRSDRYPTAQDLQLEIERYMETEGLKCAPRELGAWVAGRFADRRKEVRGLLDSQLSKLRASESSPSFRVLKLRDPRSGRASAPSRPSPVPREDGDRDSARSDNSSGLGALARSDPGATGTTGSWTRPRSRWVVLGGGVAAIATALVIGSVARTKAPEAPTVGSAILIATASVPPNATAIVSATPSSLTPAAAALVHVSLVATVPGAEFAFDDEPNVPSPVLVTRPRDQETHRITVTAPGYQSETKSVTLDHDVIWSVELVAKPVASARAPTALVASPPAAAIDASPPAAAIDASPPPAAIDASPAAGPKAHKKPLLDPGNPYAD